MNAIFRKLSLNLPTYQIFVVVGGLPFLLALVLVLTIAKDRYDVMHASSRVASTVALIEKSSGLSDAIQREITLGTASIVTGGAYRDEFGRASAAVDQATTELQRAIAQSSLDPVSRERFEAYAVAAQAMQEIRQLAVNGTETPAQIFERIAAIELAHDSALLSFADSVSDNALAASILDLRDFMKVKYAIAREQTLLVGGSARAYLEADDAVAYFDQVAIQKAFIAELEASANPIVDRGLRALADFEQTQSFEQYRTALLSETLRNYEPMTIVRVANDRLNVARTQQAALLAEVQTTQNALASQARATLVVVTVSGFVCLLLSAVVAVGFSRVVSDLMQTLADRAERMTEGDLDVKLPKAGSNAISLLIRSLAKFRDSARQTRDEAKARLEQERNEFETMRQRSETEKQRATRIARDLEQTAQAAEELANSVASAASSTRTVDQLAAVVRHKTQEGDSEVQSAMGAMDRISTAQNEITSIINIIEEIAFQTNLLALNARVEAARAGEYGRGFAVVATEVQQLAARSTRAANEVSGLIEKATHEIEGGVKIVKQSGKTLGEISKGNAEIAETISSVARMLDEQSSTLNDISAAAGRLDNEMRGLSQGDMRFAAE